MSKPAPPIDPRTAAEVKARLVNLLAQWTTHQDAPTTKYPFAPWHEFDPVTREPVGASAALIGIAARFAELVIERINQVPDKNFLAFLDLLGAANDPPRAARVPLTFTLAAGRTLGTQVPQGTQVAAAPALGDKDPVVFETEHRLELTAARLAWLLTLDPLQDLYGDWTARLALPSPPQFPIFQGERAVEHMLYLGDKGLLGHGQIKGLRVLVELESPLAGADPRQLQWEHWDGSRWQPRRATADETAQLTQSGHVDFGPIAAVPESVVNQRSQRWLRCRLLTPVTASAEALAGMVRASQLPRIARIALEVHLRRTGTERIAPDLGFSNGAALDMGKAFWPFGEKPRRNDSLLLASAEAFSKDRHRNPAATSATVKIEFTVANPHVLPGTGSVRPSADLELAWECWTGSDWQRVGTSTAPAWLGLLEVDPAPQLKTGGTSTVATVLGSAQPGAQVTLGWQDAAGLAATRFLAVGTDGRFADQVVLGAGLNVLRFDARRLGRSSTCWVVLFNGHLAPAALDWVLPAQPVAAAQLEIGVSIGGEKAQQVRELRITSGQAGNPVDRVPWAGRPIVLALAEGRNDWLVEALDAANAVIAARPLTIGRLGVAPAVRVKGFADGSFGLTQSGVVSLRLPETTAATAVNGQENFWLRVRLVQGDYGKDAGYALKDPVKPEDGFTLVQASLRPPIVAAVRIGYEQTLRHAPACCLTYNQLTFEEFNAAEAAPWAPFSVDSQAPQPACYLGFVPPAGRESLPDSAYTLYAAVAAPRYGERPAPLSPFDSLCIGSAGQTVTHRFTVSNAAPQRGEFTLCAVGSRWQVSAPTGIVAIESGATAALAVSVVIPAAAQAGDLDRGFVQLRLVGDPGWVGSARLTSSVDRPPANDSPGLSWQYWNGRHWANLTVKDGTENFSRAGLLEFIAPPDLAGRTLFGRSGHWLRVCWDGGVAELPPRLDRLLLNTTLARQTLSIQDETLGSSNGAQGQVFRCARTPVLKGQQLVVRELEAPSSADQRRLAVEEGADAVSVVTDANGQPQAYWVRWHEVPDFYGSGPHDRHYVINHLSGELRFGNGSNGRVPPRGTGNLRLATYQTGGGERGNVAVGSVTQLKTTVPYVEKVGNAMAAAGGSDAEPTDRLCNRMPRALRHLDRAVTLEDFEDLAQLASPAVARALCVPMRRLDADPLGRIERPGSVSLVIVPRQPDVRPLPTLELLAQVADFVGQRASAGAELAVVGPLYIRVDVRAEVAVLTSDAAGTVARAVVDRLAAFLHPLSGGLARDGWGFGRAPHRSDLFALIEAIPGVDHVRFLDVTEAEDQPGVRETGRFLVFSGQHRISPVFVTP